MWKAGVSTISVSIETFTSSCRVFFEQFHISVPMSLIKLARDKHTRAIYQLGLQTCWKRKRGSIAWHQRSSLHQLLYTASNVRYLQTKSLVPSSQMIFAAPRAKWTFWIPPLATTGMERAALISYWMSDGCGMWILTMNQRALEVYLE